MPSSIVFGAINVNGLDTMSLVAVGENSQSAWDTHSKNDYGNSFVFGLSNIAANAILINDQSIINAPINDQDFKPVSEIIA